MSSVDELNEEFNAVQEKQKELIRERDNTFNGYCIYCGQEIRGQSYHAGTACKVCEESGFAKSFDESLAADYKKQKRKQKINKIKRFFGFSV